MIESSEQWRLCFYIVELQKTFDAITVTRQLRFYDFSNVCINFFEQYLYGLICLASVIWWEYYNDACSTFHFIYT